MGKNNNNSRKRKQISSTSGRDGQQMQQPDKDNGGSNKEEQPAGGDRRQEMKKKKSKKEKNQLFTRARGDGGFGGARWKEKVLILCSRGTTYRFRHLMNDLISLLPHSKVTSKLDTKSDRRAVNEMAEMKGCTSSLLFEVRRHRDLYMWISKIPEGPSMKFHVTNVHTMDELKLTGNHMRGTRSLLSFSEEFGDDDHDEQQHGQKQRQGNGKGKGKGNANSNGIGNGNGNGSSDSSNVHLRLMKELFIHIFGVPKGHRKSKPFYDHVISFSLIDDRIWIRNFQIIVPGGEQKTGKASLDDMSLAEVGPRMCLNPVKIFTGSHSGGSLYSNASFMTPTAMRIQAKKDMKDKYVSRVKSRKDREQYVDEYVNDVANELKKDTFRNVFKVKENGNNGSFGNATAHDDDNDDNDEAEDEDDDDEEEDD